MLKPMKLIETNTLEELHAELDSLLKLKRKLDSLEEKRDISFIISGVQNRISNFHQNQPDVDVTHV